MPNLIHKNESYFVMEIHNTLGKGFNEAIYADPLEIELESNGVPFDREVKYDIYYKGKLLRKKYSADFVVDNKIILELKAVEAISKSHIKQTLNYLAVSKLKLGIVINFGEDSLSYKRVIL